MIKKGKILPLKREISNNRGKSLEKEIQEYLKINMKIMCKGIGRRPVFIHEYLLYLKGRHDKSHRIRRFYAGIELLKKVKLFNLTDTQLVGNGLYSYEFKGMTPKGKLVGIHIKEYREGNNKILKLVSTFGRD